MFEKKCRDIFIYLFLLEVVRWISPILFFNNNFFLLLFGTTSLNKIIIYIFPKHKLVMELVKYRIILQIGVGQDDKFGKENTFFKGSKWLIMDISQKTMTRKV